MQPMRGWPIFREVFLLRHQHVSIFDDMPTSLYADSICANC